MPLEKWLVPHFEKMLYDNAQLMEAYLAGPQVPSWLDTSTIIGQLSGIEHCHTYRGTLHLGSILQFSRERVL